MPGGGHGFAWWLLDVDTTGYQNLSLRFDNTSTSGAGATSVDVGWAVAGGPFTTVQTLPLSSSWTSYTVDLSGIAAIQDAPNVQLRGLWGIDGTPTPGSTTFN